MCCLGHTTLCPPLQWNWDSAIVASGWAVFDEARAWREIEMLFSGQWEDGMVPSIIFHKPTDSYFPGPEIWGTKEHPGRTTGISQPPVAAMSVRFLYEHAQDVELAQVKLQELFPKLLAWHRWWYKVCRWCTRVRRWWFMVRRLQGCTIGVQGCAARMEGLMNAGCWMVPPQGHQVGPCSVLLWQ